ncbi:hypothetical protein AGMMS49944_08170 [Spirochaetia bacterium]|nr:hypothetical protein AGMMS49944_08170 [Spirochaetia bacterium]
MAFLDFFKTNGDNTLLNATTTDPGLMTPDDKAMFSNLVTLSSITAPTTGGTLISLSTKHGSNLEIMLLSGCYRYEMKGGTGGRGGSSKHNGSQNGGLGADGEIKTGTFVIPVSQTLFYGIGGPGQNGGQGNGDSGGGDTQSGGGGGASGGNTYFVANGLFIYALGGAGGGGSGANGSGKNGGGGAGGGAGYGTGGNGSSSDGKGGTGGTSTSGGNGGDGAGGAFSPVVGEKDL